MRMMFSSTNFPTEFPATPPAAAPIRQPRTPPSKVPRPGQIAVPIAAPVDEPDTARYPPAPTPAAVVTLRTVLFSSHNLFWQIMAQYSIEISQKQRKREKNGEDSEI